MIYYTLGRWEKGFRSLRMRTRKDATFSGVHVADVWKDKGRWIGYCNLDGKFINSNRLKTLRNKMEFHVEFVLDKNLFPGREK